MISRLAWSQVRFARLPADCRQGERLIRLRDGAVVDDIQLTGGGPVEDIIRHVGQLG